MCWEIDYRFLAEQRKAQQDRIKEERRTGVIQDLLNEATKQPDTKTEKSPADEVVPAK